MGIPSFFRWLSERYPKCCTSALKPELDENLVKANPNNEVDNLYIDMNDLLHQASHPDDAKVPETFEQCMENLVYQIEEIIRITRPRHMIYFAFDGVAPKAKITLQRKRRFAGYQNAFLSQKRLQLLEIYRKETNLPQCPKPKKKWNSNTLSPGTKFMKDVGDWMANWIHEKQLNDSFWTGLYVILSDTSTPGEGEHKIMQHIRRMRKEPGYNPDTQHVVVGRDADLILLALGTHEPNFRILRQMCFYGKQLKCPMCFRHGHCRDCVFPPAELPDRPDNEFIFFDINMFRHCFAQDIMQIVPDIELENAINDLILLTFLIGNDFLPKIPGLSIRSGALELLIEVYKTHLLVNKTYVTTEAGDINPVALRDYLILVANRESDLITQEFRINRRCIKALKKKGQIHQKNKDKLKEENEKFNEQDAVDIDASEKLENQAHLDRLEELFPLASFEHTSVTWFNGLTLKQQLRYLDLTMYVVPPRMRDSQLKIPFGMHWKRIYYSVRFDIKLPKSVAKTKAYVHNPEVRTILNEYMKGFLWCWKYYTSENPDWDWYYPYHYGPCMSDLTRCLIKDVSFPVDSKPLDPLTLLMAVLPVSDSDLVPEPYRHLLNSADSPIADLYPTKCTVDYSEAYVFWQGVWQLPFMDYDRLTAAVQSAPQSLSESDLVLARVSPPRVFVSSIMDLGHQLLGIYGHQGKQWEKSTDYPFGTSRDPVQVEEDEFSVFCKEIIPIDGFVPMMADGRDFKVVAAYMLPLEKENFCMKLLKEAPEIPELVDDPLSSENFRRFGTLRKLWYKVLEDQRSRMIKEAKVLGFCNPQEEEPSVFHKNDPAKNRQDKERTQHPMQSSGPNYNKKFYDRRDRPGQKAPSSSQVDAMFKLLMQQKLGQMMNGGQNSGMRDLMSMFQVLLSMHNNQTSTSSFMAQNSGNPVAPSPQAMQSMMRMAMTMQNMGNNQNMQNPMMQNNMQSMGPGMMHPQMMQQPPNMQHNSPRGFMGQMNDMSTNQMQHPQSSMAGTSMNMNPMMTGMMPNMMQSPMGQMPSPMSQMPNMMGMMPNVVPNQMQHPVQQDDSALEMTDEGQTEALTPESSVTVSQADSPGDYTFYSAGSSNGGSTRSNYSYSPSVHAPTPDYPHVTDHQRKPNPDHQYTPNPDHQIPGVYTQPQNMQQFQTGYQQSYQLPGFQQNYNTNQFAGTPGAQPFQNNQWMGMNHPYASSPKMMQPQMPKASNNFYNQIY